MKALRFIDLELGSGWTFDSWVVTHWDADHFRGVKDLLVNNEIQFTRCYRNGANVTKGGPGNFASLYFNPKPVLLCGAWDTKAMFKGGGDFLRLFVKEDKCQLWEGLKEAKQRSPEGQTLLRCIWGQALIGLDLFTRSFYFDHETGLPSYKETRGISMRLESDGNDPVSKNTPRFCVVGANGYGIGMPIACKSKPTRNETSILALLYWTGQDFCSYYTGGDGHPKVVKEPVQEWFKKRWPGGDVEMVKLDHHGSTGENLGKIPHAEGEDKKIEEEETPSESDTDSEAEMEEENSKKTDDLEIEVTNDQEKAMKDAKEIGIVIDYMKPSKVLVTPGTRHGHPTWDVLIILRSYFEELSKNISSQGLNNKQAERGQGLFSTRSVYWLSKGEVSYKDINFKHVLGAVMQNRLESAEEDSKMLEEKDKKDSNDANKGDQDIEEEDEEVNEGMLRMADAKERIKAQDNWANWRKVYFKYLLDHAADDGANYYKKNGDVNKDAVNLAIAKKIKKYDKERREEIYNDEPLEEGSEEAILYELVGAFWELIEATDDAQLEGVEDFEEMCWQPLVATETEDPHFLIRFEFGEERKDTALKVFDASGQYEYEEGSTQSQKKEIKQSNSKRPQRSINKGSIHEESKEQESIHDENIQEEIIQRHSKTATGLIIKDEKDERNPWTKHAYGDCDIASMLSAISLNTVADFRMAARIRKSTKKEFTKGDSKNMIYKYYAKRPNAKAGIEEMIEWNEQKRHGNTSRRIKEEIEKEKGKKKETEGFKKIITKREVKKEQKGSRGKDHKVTSRKGKKDKKGQH
ncbi:hypothetical protein M431DRAFT_525615 [Trichoderma harzianum CBS 226.95]|uniref:Metallo-beta-lactamase domain-containing protein n=1 Tax=Trichoderma harzianum CBS 226.95 TaxID=983964 RepID=A0A2T3ZTJ9_TRIHA|nr:hypothetical protein M431DRAFT_525615 [Trichoderma harzianum CBS 226.95]PTB48126.1 hypothetical protein M431DRAFT_525615 [Trichoderma harzianum CBS 226.95]